MKPFRCVTSTEVESSDQFAVFDVSSAMALLSSAQPMRYCLILHWPVCTLLAVLTNRAGPIGGCTFRTLSHLRIMPYSQGVGDGTGFVVSIAWSTYVLLMQHGSVRSSGQIPGLLL